MKSRAHKATFNKTIYSLPGNSFNALCSTSVRISRLRHVAEFSHTCNRRDGLLRLSAEKKSINGTSEDELQELGSQLKQSFLDEVLKAGAQLASSETEQQTVIQQEPQQPNYSELPDRIGFVGVGQMGEALLRSFMETGVSSSEKICASIRSAERRQALENLGIQIFNNALEEEAAASLAQNSDIIILAVKPVYVEDILSSLRAHITQDHLIVSIVAGVKLNTLESNLPEGTRVVRVMPNTPCLIGQCASAYVTGTNAGEEEAEKAATLMSAVGMTVEVEERMMDAVTGLSGSGPAYVFLIIEALADGGVAAGLPREKALALAAQTVVGASRMVLEASGDGSLMHPAILRDRVASPAGTTITGLAELETSGVRGALIRAVKAAARRRAAALQNLRT